MELKKIDSISDDKIYVATEADANRFNLWFLGVLSVFVIICIVLNEIGVFHVSKKMLILSMSMAFVFFNVPIVSLLVHDKILKKPSILVNGFYHLLIIICAYLGVSIVCVLLSHHSIVLLGVPILIAAQYRYRRRLFTAVLIATILFVPVSVYGSYFLGLPDRNFIKGALTEEEALILSNRVDIATPKRMVELFIHYVLPRLFGVIAIGVLAMGITRRNGIMIDRQIDLAKEVRAETERRYAQQEHVIGALATLIETRDVGTGEHVQRTQRYVFMIASAMKKDEKFKDVLTDEEIELMKNAAPLHDVGKIAVSDTVLLKPARLTAEEFDQIKLHTVKGGDIVNSVFAPLNEKASLKMAEEIAVSHHEWWNGNGYPNGLKGEDIPLPARIMAVADVFDALVSVRVYKKAVAPEEAFDIMMSESGTHFDPDIMRVVSGIREKLISAAKNPDYVVSGRM